MRALLLAACAALLCACADEVGFTSRDYTDPKGVPHRSLRLSRAKRGLFWGSCGPATRSLQWEYELDLAGPGPGYGPGAVALRPEAGPPMPVTGGSARFDAKEGALTLDLRIAGPDGARAFERNGRYVRLK